MRGATLLACVGMAAFAASAAGQGLPEPGERKSKAPEAADSWQQRGIVDFGEPARLQGVLRKAGRGEPITVGVIGGSITAGAAASSEESRWGNRVADWWRRTFPDTPVRFVNAGIGATGSDLGAHRAQKDLLAQRPDFVVVEYAVNDPGNPLREQTLEGLLRQILLAPNRPACMLLYTMNERGENTQAEHERVARHYGLPAVSFRDAFWPEIQAGRMAWKDIEEDAVHPNDKGHALCAELIVAVLERVRAEMPEDGAAAPEPPPIPEPLTSDTFQHARMLTGEALTPSANHGWEASPGHHGIGPGWSAREPGAAIEFTVEGTCVSVVYHHVRGDVGMAEVRVDDREPVVLDAYFPDDWGGGYTRFKAIAQDLPPGRHTVRVRILEQTHPESHGHAFTVDAVCVAGLR